MSKKDDKLDPRVRRTRQLLRQALIELIPEMGYENIRIQDITDRATLNRATFYLHYRNKEDLLRQGMQEIMDELNASRPIPANQGDQFSYDAVIQSYKMDFEHIQQYDQFYRVMLGQNGVWHFVQGFQEYLYNEAKARWNRLKPKKERDLIEPDFVLHQLAAGFIGVIQWWLSNDMPFTPEEMAKRSLTLYRDGTFHCLGYEVEQNSFRLE